MSVARAVHCAAYVESIDSANTLLHNAIARLAGIPSWDGHDASRARVAMPLKAGRLGIDVLANPDHAAVAAMASAVASLHSFARDVNAIGGWLGNAGYASIVDAANTALDPDALVGPQSLSSVAGIVQAGWTATYDIAAASNAMAAQRVARVRRLHLRLTTVQSFPAPGRGEIDVNITYKIPRTVAELRAQAAATSKPKMQKSILSHAHAVAYVNMVQDELHHLSSCHLESLCVARPRCHAAQGRRSRNRRACQPRSRCRCCNVVRRCFFAYFCARRRQHWRLARRCRLRMARHSR